MYLAAIPLQLLNLVRRLTPAGISPATIDSSGAFWLPPNLNFLSKTPVSDQNPAANSQNISTFSIFSGYQWTKLTTGLNTLQGLSTFQKLFMEFRDCPRCNLNASLE